MKKYHISKITGTNTVINCKTEQEVISVLTILHDGDFSWMNGRGLLDVNNWEEEKELTCYNPNFGRHITYDNCDFYKEKGYLIITAQQFISDNQVDKKPKSMLITSDNNNLINSMRRDLEAVGYVFSSLSKSEGNAILHNTPMGPQFDEISKEDFKELYHSTNKGWVTTHNFILPQDYDVALQYAKDSLLPEKWEEEFKVGDMVFIIGAEGWAQGANEKVGIITNRPRTKGFESELRIQTGLNVIWGVGKNAKLRKATPEEIEIYNNKKEITLTLGSREAIVNISKNKIAANGNHLNYELLKAQYHILLGFSNGVGKSIGEYDLHIISKTDRIYRVGCEDSDNRVSLNEIEQVINAYEKINT